MSTNTYFFVDGSSLLADISRINKTKPIVSDKKFSISTFYLHFSRNRKYQHLVGNGYRRFSIYFVNGENRIDNKLIIPDFREPNKIEDFNINYCGKKMEGSRKVDKWLADNNPPQFMKDRFHKSEKAVDTQICCDALQLAANKKLDRLFLYTNDYDFMPLIDVLKNMGVNISLFRLIQDNVNSELVNNFDSFSVPDEKALIDMFK